MSAQIPLSLFDKIAPRIGGVIFGLMFMAIPGFILTMAVVEFARDLDRNSRYQAATATVTDVKGLEPEADEVTVAYRFAAGGKSYTGKLTAEEKDKKQFDALRKYAKGQTLTIYYDPQQPEQSKVTLKPNTMFLGMVMFIVPFMVIGVAALCGTITRESVKNRFLRGGPRAFLPPAAVITVMIAGPVLAFVHFMLTEQLSWPMNLWAGLGLMLIVYPGIVFFIGRIFRSPPRTAPAEEIPRVPLADHHVPAAVQALSDPAANLPGEEIQADDEPPALGSLKKKLLGSIAVTLFWCGITGAFVGFAVFSIAKSLDAKRRFLETPGVVLSSKIDSSSDSEGTTYTPVVKYRYTVGGQVYVSKQYSYGMGGTSEYGYVAGVVADHPAGKRVTVYYDPDKPAEAILFLGVPPVMYFMLLFLQPFILIGLAMIGWCFTLPGAHRRMREFVESPLPPQLPWRIPTWGLLDTDGAACTVHPSRLGHAMVALVAGYGACCFICIFVVGFCFGGFGAPSLVAIRMAFLTALGVGLVAAIVSLVRRKPQFSFDTMLRELSLTGPRRNLHLNFRDIEHWVVRPIANPRRTRSDSDTATAPLLAIQTVAGVLEPIHVFKADKDAPAIAKKVGQALAAMTDRPLKTFKAKFPDPAAVVGKLLSGADGRPSIFGLMKAALQARQTKPKSAAPADRYGDLT